MATNSVMSTNNFCVGSSKNSYKTWNSSFTTWLPEPATTIWGHSY